MMPTTTNHPNSRKQARLPPKRHLFDQPRNVRTLVRGLVIACTVLVLLDGVVHRHVDHPWESLFGFYAIYGFAACVVLVLLAKEMRKLVMRAEGYYRSRADRQHSGRKHGEGDD